MLAGNPRYNPVILSMSFSMGGPPGSACVHTSGYVCVDAYTCLRVRVCFCSLRCWQFTTIIGVASLVLYLRIFRAFFQVDYMLIFLIGDLSHRGALKKTDRGYFTRISRFVNDRISSENASLPFSLPRCSKYRSPSVAIQHSILTLLTKLPFSIGSRKVRYITAQ